MFICFTLNHHVTLQASLQCSSFLYYTNTGDLCTASVSSHYPLSLADRHSGSVSYKLKKIKFHNSVDFKLSVIFIFLINDFVEKDTLAQ